MPGTLAVGGTVFVLADGREEALTKAHPHFAQARKDRHASAEETLTASTASLEEFVPARRRPLGLYSQNLTEITLTDPQDQTQWKLAVCLVPR